jgi:hypothetical protein
VRELVDSLFDGDRRRLQAYLSGANSVMMAAPPIQEEPDALDAALL